MRIILTILTIFYLLINPIGTTQEECSIRTISQAIPPIIFYEQTIDGKEQHPVVTRFFHNKANIFMSQFAKCYARQLEPLEVYAAIGFIGLLFWANFIYEVLMKKYWVLLTIFLVIPILSIFIKDSRITAYTYKIFAMIGCAYFLKRIK